MTDTDSAIKKVKHAEGIVLWLPVFLLAGGSFYFAMAHEPASWLIIALAVVGITCLAAAWFGRHVSMMRRTGLALGFVAIGLLSAFMRTHYYPTQLLCDNIWNADITGVIESIEPMGQGWRIVLADAVITSKEMHDCQSGNGKTPCRFRVSLRKRGLSPQTGQQVKVRANLLAPSPPLLPGAFDFQRHAYFQSFSGYGYITRWPDENAAEKIIAEPSGLERYREWLARKVHGQLHQPSAGIITALLNGQRAGISRATTQSLQQSGLQHIISISGLHIGLMAATIFFLVRFILALNMRLALTWPIKKIAAVAAMLGIVVYMGIVGLSPPTVRSVLMTGIVLLGIMVDREAIQLRVVALAGLTILLLQPESAVDIGFQMSFAAVAGLVAFFHETRYFWQKPFWKEYWFGRLLRTLLMAIATTLVATVTTAPLVMLYFQQIPILSVLSNVMVAPLTTLLIMPGTFFVYLFLPVPVLGPLALTMMDLGVRGMLMISSWVVSLPHATWHMPGIGALATILLLAALFLVVLVQGRLRLFCIPLLALGLWAMSGQSQPDIFLTPGRMLLIKAPESDVLWMDGRAGGFEKDILLQATGRTHIENLPCDGEICMLEVAGKNIRILRSVVALREACAQPADVIVTRYYLDHGCKGTLVLDRRLLERAGSAAVVLQPTPKILSAHDDFANRPWQQRLTTKERWQFYRPRSKIQANPQEPKGGTRHEHPKTK